MICPWLGNRHNVMNLFAWIFNWPPSESVSDTTSFYSFYEVGGYNYTIYTHINNKNLYLLMCMYVRVYIYIYREWVGCECVWVCKNVTCLYKCILIDFYLTVLTYLLFKINADISLYLSIYIYICTCVCVCAHARFLLIPYILKRKQYILLTREREREKETNRQIEWEIEIYWSI